MKILNAYAGIGGNRRHWKGLEVTAIEKNPDIAQAYQDLHPEDDVFVCDAHEFILENYKRFDFIWTSPPCQSHTKLMAIHNNRENETPRYPDFRLYEEIVFLQKHCKALWLVENVTPYYQPLVRPSLKLGRHLFWSNFRIQVQHQVNYDFTRHNDLKEMARVLEIPFLKRIKLPKGHPEQVLRNCVHPVLGEQILASAMGWVSQFKPEKRGLLF
jgi:DNA (cytosine-5)-methyltransferase 1